MGAPKGNHSVTCFVTCVDNSNYEASLERRKIYEVVPDPEATRDGDIRIIDERGEDYLCPIDRFVAIEIPDRVEQAIR